MANKLRKIDHWLYGRYKNWYYWCYNPNSARYAAMKANNIEIHQPWLDNFWRCAAWVEKNLGAPVGDRTALDRIDNSKGFQPGNLRWNTNQENHQNRMNTIWIKIGRNRMSINDWCAALNLCKATVYSRVVDLGWTNEEALGLVKRTRDKRPK